MRSGHPSVRTIPLGFFGALVLIAATEFSIEQNAIYSLGGNHWSYRVAEKMARTDVKSNQVLYFGDSLLKLGLAPRVIEAETGLRGYNFAQAGGQVPGSYFFLRQALESGAKPAAIVVEFFPSLLCTGTKLNNENWPFLARLSDGLSIARYGGGMEVFGSFAVRRLLPSMRSRTSLRAAIQTAFQTDVRIVQSEILAAILNWKTNRGAEITASVLPAASGIDLDSWEKAYFPHIQCLPIHLHYLHKFFNLAAANQIPVFWLLPPYRSDMRARCEHSGFNNEHLAFVHQIQSAHPNVTVFDGQQSQFPDEVFRDPHHLGLEGAAVFSSDVGQALTRSLGETDSPYRWVTLPLFRARPINAPLESFDASRVAVTKATLQGRRGELLR